MHEGTYLNSENPFTAGTEGQSKGIRNGYRKDSPSIECYVRIKKGYGKEKWGAIPGKRYYVLTILSMREL